MNDAIRERRRSATASSFSRLCWEKVAEGPALAAAHPRGGARCPA